MEEMNVGNDNTNARQTTDPTEGNAMQNQPQGEAVGTLAGNAGKTEGQTGAPDAYDFTGSLPEGAELDEAIAREFGEVCRGMNLTNDQANELAKYGYGYAQNVVNAVEAARQDAIAKMGEETKKALGAEFGSTMGLVGQAVEKLEREFPDIRQALNETGAGNNLTVIKVLAKVGTLLREDPGVDGAPGGGRTDNMYSNTDWSKI